MLSQHLPSVHDERAIYSATEDGRVPFIDAQDIACVAVKALTNRHVENGELLLTGPNTLTYDNVATQLSDAVGTKVVHRRLGQEEMAARFVRAGMPGGFAHALAAMDVAIAGGTEDRLSEAVKEVTGRAPTPFHAFAAHASAAWHPRDRR